jgi:hypothetical protein
MTASDKVVGWLTGALLTFILLSLIAVVHAMNGG